MFIPTNVLQCVVYRFENFRNDKRIVVLQSLKVTYLFQIDFMTHLSKLTGYVNHAWFCNLFTYLFNMKSARILNQCL